MFIYGNKECLQLVKYLKRSNKISRQPVVCAKVCPDSATAQRHMSATKGL